MTLISRSNRVCGAALVCAVLCFFSIFSFAQDQNADPPKDEPTSENRASTLDFQKPEKIILNDQKTKGSHELSHTMQQRSGTTEAQSGDPDRPVISGQVPDPEPRAAQGYLKIGDIKGESGPENQKKVPAHTPEWTDDKTGDPGQTTDKDHKDWINLDSVSQSTSEGKTARVPKRQGDVTLKRGAASEGGATHEDNWRENNAARSTPVRGLKAAIPTPNYTCPDNKEEECTCSGVLDCNNLFISDKCKKDTQWQDGEDPSKGGCIQKSSSKTRPRAAFMKLGDIKGEATDSKHKDWIVIESMSSPLGQQSTENMSITPKPQAYNCPPNDPECYCNGVLDCKKLWSSGICKPNSEWEDSHDNSKGGCIEN